MEGERGLWGTVGDFRKNYTSVFNPRPLRLFGPRAPTANSGELSAALSLKLRTACPLENVVS